MTRYSLVSAACTVVLSALMLPSARADEFADPFAVELQSPPAAATEQAQPSLTPVVSEPVTNDGPVIPRPAVFTQTSTGTGPAPQPIDAGYGMMAPQAAPQQPGYVHLGAPMYPSPRPNIPIWAGSTMITNPAFAPHEMLYPHSYRAMYPPYYHRVKGGWILTPFGVRSHEKWELQGTQVQVNYRSQYPELLKGKWYPPTTSYWHGPWK